MSCGDKQVMALSVGDILEVSLEGANQLQAVYNVWQYRVTTLTGAPLASDWGQAWWDEVKTNMRAIMVNTPNFFWNTVKVRDITDPLGIYGEYIIPAGEKSGTRSSAGLTEPTPSFLGMGVRLSVATRATRPGQKRFSFLMEEDVQGQVLTAPYVALVNTLMTQMTADLTLAAPAASCVLTPVVVSKGATGLAVAEQDIVGFGLKGVVTSQVSRKLGRGI